MQSSRSERDREEGPESVAGPSRYKTSTNRYEADCWVCGDTYYVDGVTFDRINRAAGEGTDNPFVCADCDEAESDELAHGR